MKDHQEVRPLSREMMLPVPVSAQSLFASLQGDVRFFLFPLPALPSVSLRSLSYPVVPAGEVQVYHVLCEYQCGLGFTCPPVAQHLRQQFKGISVLATYHFGAGLPASLARSILRWLR